MPEFPDVTRDVEDAMNCLRDAVGVAIASAKTPMGKDVVDLGSFISDRRRVLNMSLEDVATAAHCTKSHVWEMEHRHSHNPTVLMVYNLSVALRVPFEVLAASALVSARNRR